MLARTEVMRGEANVMKAMMGFFNNAEKRMDICIGVVGVAQNPETAPLTQAFLDLLKKGTRIRIIGEITSEAIGQVREISKTMEIRSLSGIRSYFGVSDSEYVAVPGRDNLNPSGPILYSSEEPFVKHHQALFEMLWDRAIPADVRIEELEKGEEVGETRITFSTQEIMESAGRFADGMKQEALVLIPREGGLKNNIEIFERIARRAATTGAKVRILGRFQKDEEELVKKFQAEGFQFKFLSSGRLASLALGIYDRRGMGLVEYRYPGVARQTGGPYLTGVISTNKQTVEGIAAIFDSLWEESELRREAELMRDIMTHDLRNYNQVLMSNAEVLKEGLASDRELKKYVDAILGAVDGANRLVENTKVLGKIIVDEGPTLQPVDLLVSLERSLALAKKGDPAKTVVARYSLPSRAMVKADSLLDQVFVNLFTNAIRYTGGRRVQLDIRVSPAKSGAAPRVQRYWKVEVSDYGRGMPDETKSNAALRYLGSLTRGGLGLSIARALTVDRYSGKFELRDRVTGDFARGLKAEVWLPKK